MKGYLVMSYKKEGDNNDLQDLKNTADETRKTILNSKSRSKLFEIRIEREWLTTQEAAHYLLVTPNALRIMVHRNQVKAFKFGKRLRFRLDDCRTLFSSRGA
jgi:excisionase family DNA binding protein